MTVDTARPPMPALSENVAHTRGGVSTLLLTIGSFLATTVVLVVAIITLQDGRTALGVALLVLSGALLVAGTILASGLYMLQPNQAAALTLFGDYRGTDRRPGLRFANPFYAKHKVSLRVRNFTTATSKVNDANGNPIMVASVVVWRVTDSARALFAVDDFVEYVELQAESALRQLARSYPYDAFDGSDATTLIGDTGEVNERLSVELRDRVAEAGVEVMETRITDLSYAPEIAEAMLRRQQASAIVAARTKIVEGAVLMVREAIEALEAGSDDAGDAIPLDSDRRATFASNLMTVIASDHPTSPVVNVGTLHR